MWRSAHIRAIRRNTYLKCNNTSNSEIMYLSLTISLSLSLTYTYTRLWSTATINSPYTSYLQYFALNICCCFSNKTDNSLHLDKNIHELFHNFTPFLTPLFLCCMCPFLFNTFDRRFREYYTHLFKMHIHFPCIVVKCALHDKNKFSLG